MREFRSAITNEKPCDHSVRQK
uniref:Uncharacterized protein n=1 Tax=Anguilla anguilla TaxID=7936 RepID=A0A0E9P6K9_ANGAN